MESQQSRTGNDDKSIFFQPWSLLPETISMKLLYLPFIIGHIKKLMFVLIIIAKKHFTTCPGLSIFQNIPANARVAREHPTPDNIRKVFLNNDIMWNCQKHISSHLPSLSAMITWKELNSISDSPVTRTRTISDMPVELNMSTR